MKQIEFLKTLYKEMTSEKIFDILKYEKNTLSKQALGIAIEELKSRNVDIEKQLLVLENNEIEEAQFLLFKKEKGNIEINNILEFIYQCKIYEESNNTIIKKLNEKEINDSAAEKLLIMLKNKCSYKISSIKRLKNKGFLLLFSGAFFLFICFMYLTPSIGGRLAAWDVFIFFFKIISGIAFLIKGVKCLELSNEFSKHKPTLLKIHDSI